MHQPIPLSTFRAQEYAGYGRREVRAAAAAARFGV